MTTKTPEKPNNLYNQSSTGAGSSLFGILRSPLSWMRARGLTPTSLNDVKDDAMVVDSGAGIQDLSRDVKKDASFGSASTQPLTSQSSQEYERSWGMLLERPEDLEIGAASAERAVKPCSMAEPPPVSRETSGSSLGKRPRSDSAFGSPQKRRAPQPVDGDDPFTASKFNSVKSPQEVPLHIIVQLPEGLGNSVQALPWMALWEIARHITTGLKTYDDFKPYLSSPTGLAELIRLLRPSSANVVAGPTAGVSETQDWDPKDVWAESEREEAALNVHHCAGLGNGISYAQETDPKRHGGRVNFTARLKEKDRSRRDPMGTDGTFELVLQKPELGPSNRFARRFGSRRFIRVRVPKQMLGGNKVFRAFHAKDGNVFLVETKDPRICKPPPGPSALSFLDFLEFHNPRAFNGQQPLAKWSARFALGLSNSVPGVLVDEHNIHHIDDIIAPHDGKGKPPAEKIMTDGCGFINIHGLRRLQAKLQWEKLPTAVQVRIDGAKGLLLLHPDGKYADGDPATHVSIRPSQTKIHYDEGKPVDSARRVIDVLQPARLKYPSRLSAETIINIAHNKTGSPKEKHKVLLQLMHNGLEEAISGFVRWAQNPPHEVTHEMPLLWHEISKAGGVMAMRMAREFSGSARARGFASRWDEVEQDEEEETSSAQPLSESPPGPPATVEETAMDLISSGFNPKDSRFLNDKVKFIVRKVLIRYTQEFRIVVPGSAEAFCVPDPKGVLEPGEVFLRTSQPIKSQNGVDVDVLQGDVLVSRHPTKTPTDVQRVKAVFKQELFEYTDVIIFSTKGDRSLASLLAGGDYDGDTVSIIWERGLVEGFVNADLKFSMPPGGLNDNFEHDANETVASFQERTVEMPVENVIRDLQSVLLGALRDVSIVGSYSIFHDNAVYSKGYDHPETIRLAYMFCTCLDGGKSGLRVKKKVFHADKRRWDIRGPHWKEIEEPFLNDQKSLKRDKVLGAFVMDELKLRGQLLGDLVNKKWQEKLQFPDSPDADLIRPWTDANSRANKLEKTLGVSDFITELKKISNHVDKVREQWVAAWQSSGTPSKALIKSPSAGSRSRSSNIGNKIISDIILSFSQGPEDLRLYTDSQREELKASYAYYKHSQTTFAWKVAFQELLRIKASSLHGSSVTPEFYKCFDIQSGVKALGRRMVQ